jgi:hypothetical protein
VPLVPVGPVGPGPPGEPFGPVGPGGPGGPAGPAGPGKAGKGPAVEGEPKFCFLFEGLVQSFSRIYTPGALSSELLLIVDTTFEWILPLICAP